MVIQSSGMITCGSLPVTKKKKPPPSENLTDDSGSNGTAYRSSWRRLAALRPRTRRERRRSRATRAWTWRVTCRTPWKTNGHGNGEQRAQPKKERASPIGRCRRPTTVDRERIRCNVLTGGGRRWRLHKRTRRLFLIVTERAEQAQRSRALVTKRGEQKNSTIMCQRRYRWPLPRPLRRDV